MVYLQYSYTRDTITYAIYNVITYTYTTYNAVTNNTIACTSYITVTNYIYLSYNLIMTSRKTNTYTIYTTIKWKVSSQWVIFN